MPAIKFLSAGFLLVLACGASPAVASGKMAASDGQISLPTDWDVGSTHSYRVQWTDSAELAPNLSDTVDGEQLRVRTRDTLGRWSVSGDVTITVVAKTATGYQLRWEPVLSVPAMPNISIEDAAAIGRELRRYMKSIPLELTVDFDPEHDLVSLGNVSTVQHLTRLKLIELLGSKVNQSGCEEGFAADLCPMTAMTSATRSRSLALEAIQPFFACTDLELHSGEPTEWIAPHPNAAIGAEIGMHHRVAVESVDAARHEVHVATTSMPDAAQTRDWILRKLPAGMEAKARDIVANLGTSHKAQCTMDLKSGWPVTIQHESHVASSVLEGVVSTRFDRADGKPSSGARRRSRSDSSAAQAAYDLGDYAAALQKWQRSAGKGDAVSQERLGTMFLLGFGVRRNAVEAVAWYTKAAEQDNAAAQLKLFELYCCGTTGVAADHEAALRWLRAAAKRGNAQAQLQLGMKYDQGDLVSQDLAQAAQWYRKSALQGVATAQHNLAEMYHAGAGVDRDDGEALTWFRKAADQGFAPSLYSMGVLYRDGEGVARDRAQALAWFRRAADQALPLALAEAGMLLYAGGDGVTQNYAEAFTLLRAGAEKGDPSAMCALGIAYQRGDAVAQDNAQAYRWMNRSVKSDKRCQEILDQLNKKISAQDVERGKKLLALEDEQE